MGAGGRVREKRKEKEGQREGTRERSKEKQSKWEAINRKRGGTNKQRREGELHPNQYLS